MAVHLRRAAGPRRGALRRGRARQRAHARLLREGRRAGSHVRPHRHGLLGHFEAEEFAAALEAQAGGGEGAGGADDVPRARIVAEVLRAMHREGVRWVAGTDFGPGRLLEELEIYETVGIPTATILQTATSNPARWFGKDDFGTVEPGKRADLILVDGDPLERIRDLEKVDLVAKSGRVVLEE